MDDKTKGILIGALIVFLLASMVGVAMAFMNGQKAFENAGVVTVVESHNCSGCGGFVDKNGDGVCDCMEGFHEYANKTGCQFNKTGGFNEGGCKHGQNAFGGFQGSGGCQFGNQTGVGHAGCPCGKT